MGMDKDLMNTKANLCLLSGERERKTVSEEAVPP